MKTRKIILIIADILLLAGVITQCVFMSKDGGKTFKLKETPDEIVIQNGTDNVVLSFENNEWVVGDKKYKTNMSVVDSMLDGLSSIRCLDKVSSITKPNEIEKYELDEGKKITVTARKEGTDLRTIDIGKSATTGSQCFITVDGGKEIYLATGGLRYDFDMTEADIRSKIVWDFDDAEVNAVEVMRTDGTKLGVSKTGSGEDLSWSVSGADIELDTEKAQSWFDTLKSLTTSKWYDESEDLGGTKISTTRVTYGYDTATVDIYEVPPKEGKENATYYGKCSETPYPFEVSLYTMENINKKPEELAK